MAKITLRKEREKSATAPSIEVEKGANLMQSLLSHGKPVASSCYGKGICSKCRVQVVEGSENLSKPNALEKMLREKLKDTRQALAENERLSCQTRLLDEEVMLDTGYW
jgi:ferredoxin